MHEPKYLKFFLEHESNETRLAVFSRRISKDYEAHIHDFFEIEFVLSGGCIHYISGEPVECGPGSVIFITPMDMHSVKFNKTTDIITLNFDDTWISPELRELCNHSMYSHKMSSTYINLLSDEFSLKQNHYLLSERYLLNSLIIEIIRYAKRINQKRPNNISFDIARYIQVNYTSNITLESLSEEFGYTPNYLSNIFHKTIGKTVKRFIIDVRLEHALRFLLTTNDSVTNICYSSGFSSLPHFLRMFKEKYGQSPNAYRKNADN